MQRCYRLEELCNRLLSEDYGAGGHQTNMSMGTIAYDAKNSFDVSGLNGPGHNPVKIGGGNPSTGQAIDKFPQLYTMSAEDVLHFLQDLIADSMDSAKSSEAKECLKSVYNKLLTLEMSKLD